MATKTIGSTRIALIQGDITEQHVDAIVNAANNSLMGGGGVDGAIHRKGGPAILAANKEIRQAQYPDGLPTGAAVATTAGNLPARHVIHTVGPIWQGGDANEADLLTNAHQNSLQIATEIKARTIAFPAISTGVYGYPLEPAAHIALKATIEAIESHPDAFDEIRFVLFSAPVFLAYQLALKSR